MKIMFSVWILIFLLILAVVNAVGFIELELGNLNISHSVAIQGVCKTPNGSFFYMSDANSIDRLNSDGTGRTVVISPGDVGNSRVACNDFFIYNSQGDPDIVKTFSHAGVDQSEDYDYLPEPWGNVNVDVSVSANNTYLYMGTTIPGQVGTGNFSQWLTATQLEDSVVQLDLRMTEQGAGMCTLNETIFTSNMSHITQWDFTGARLGSFDFSGIFVPVDIASLGCNESDVDVNVFVGSGNAAAKKVVTFVGDKPIAPPADTCTAPGSGTWNVDCADNCNLNTAQDVPGDMLLAGTGTTRLSAALTFTGTGQELTINSSCTLSIESGGEIGGT